MTIPTFPTLIGDAWPSPRTPMWSTIKQQSISGKKTRLQLWTYPLWTWVKSFEYLGSAAGQNTDWQTLVAFYNQVAGAALPFHYNDPLDNAVTLQSIGTGDGVTTQFNFVRTMVGASGNFTEPIQDVTAVSQVTNAGTPTAAYTLITDPNWGLTYAINFNTAPTSGHALAASFTYNWPCQFNDDSAEFTQFLHNFWSLSKLSFQSMKVV